MKRLILIHMATLLSLILSSCTEREKIQMENGIELLRLEGTPFERGHLHGRLLREEIASSISGWKEEVEKSCGREFHMVVESFFSKTTCLEQVRLFDPDLEEEVYVMSEGSGLSYRTLLAFQMGEELLTVMVGDGALNCTAIGCAATGSAPTLLAQNMDPPEFLHGHPLVMHVVPDDGGPERFIFTAPGLLGLAGMNENGVGVTCNGMSMLNHDFCPRYFFVYDEMKARMGQFTVKDMQAILRSEEPGIEPVLNPSTLGTLVMALDADPVLFLAAGQERDAVFRRLDFQEE